MVRRIKALQWHAIMVKTEEPYEYIASPACPTMTRVREEAVRHCLLAHGHKEQEAGAKVRTTMIEVESGKELVERRVCQCGLLCRLFRQCAYSNPHVNVTSLQAQSSCRTRG